MRQLPLFLRQTIPLVVACQIGLHFAPRLTAAPASVGPALPGRVIDFFIPPTRSDEAYAATAKALFHFEPEQGQWRQIYAPPQNDTAILGIAGYPKASKVLYLAHTQGGAVTSDGGATWREFIPREFSDTRGRFVGLSVSPSDRKDAVLACQHALWISHDYGTTFEPLPPPGQTNEVRAISYAGGDTPLLLALTAQQLCLRSPAEAVWLGLPTPTTPPAFLAVSPQQNVAFAISDASCCAYDLARPGYHQVFPLRQPEPLKAVAADASGRRLLWAQAGGSIVRVGLQAEGVEWVPLPDPAPTARMLRAHPRAKDALFWAEENRLMLLTNALSETPPALSLPLDLSGFSQGQTQPLDQPGTAPAATGDANPLQIVQEVLARQPSLNEVLEAALKDSLYERGEVYSWKKKARLRNLLPRLRIGGGARQYPLDQSFVVTEVDRFGVASSEDLRLSDRVEYMGYIGASLEWDLGRLVYDPEEVDVNREKRYEIKHRNDLIQQINKIYYERIDLIVKLKTHAARLTSDEQTTTLLKIRQHGELLNSLCGRPLFYNDKL